MIIIVNFKKFIPFIALFELTTSHFRSIYIINIYNHHPTDMQGRNH